MRNIYGYIILASITNHVTTDERIYFPNLIYKQIRDPQNRSVEQISNAKSVSRIYLYPQLDKCRDT